jgi:hypothetical protein
MEVVTLSYPEPISVERISNLINNKNIDPAIAEINLEMIKMKLRETEEGESWTFEQCESAEIEYKRFLHLCLKYGIGIVPNKIMDTVWHYHILDTRAYSNDCQNVFGHILHHFPYFGMGGEQDAKNLVTEFHTTKDKYLVTFGEDMVKSTDEAKCWHDCQGRCHKACSSK